MFTPLQLTDEQTLPHARDTPPRRSQYTTLVIQGKFGKDVGVTDCAWASLQLTEEEIVPHVRDALGSQYWSNGTLVIHVKFGKDVGVTASARASLVVLRGHWLWSGLTGELGCSWSRSLVASMHSHDV